MLRAFNLCRAVVSSPIAPHKEFLCRWLVMLNVVIMNNYGCCMTKFSLNIGGV